MIKTALCTALLAATVTPAFADAKLDVSKSRMMMVEPDGTVVRRPETCGTMQEPPSFDPNLREPEPANALTEPQVVYLNKNGGTYTFGTAPTSAANNTVRGGSAFPSSGQAVIPPLDTTKFDWPLVVQCVADAYKRWNVTVTDVEPTSGPYVEAVAGGNEGEEVGRSGLFGIAATDTFCTLFRNGIAFNFAGTHISEFSNLAVRNREMCNTIAHEVGHVLGLEHETANKDHMSYVYIQQACPGNPNTCKSFLDMASSCGTTPQQPMTNCTCGGTSTNSAMRLTNYIGFEKVPPTLSVQALTEPLSLPGSFDVTADATDNVAMKDVAVLIDGVEVANATLSNGSTYIVHVGAVADGDHTMIVRARDHALNATDETVQIRVQLTATGEDCIDSTECRGGLCAQTSDGNFCTETCSGTSCPDGFACDDAGGQMICVPDDNGGDGDGGSDDGDGGGCCSSTSGAGGSAAGLLALGVGLVLSRRRRR